MKPRVDLGASLKKVLGLTKTYFQPPETVKLSYPCAIYELSNVDVKYADNASYTKQKRYAITIIDKDPDSDIPFRMYEFPLCSFSRFYVANNLNHWVFDLYY